MVCEVLLEKQITEAVQTVHYRVCGNEQLHQFQDEFKILSDGFTILINVY